MFRFLKLLLIVSAVAFGVIWLINHNGEVVVNWLDYQIRTDIFMAVVIAILSVVLIFFFAYLLMKTMSFSFSGLFKVSIKKSKLKKLEKAGVRYEDALEELGNALLAIEGGDVKEAKRACKKFDSLVANRELVEFLERKIELIDG